MGHFARLSFLDRYVLAIRRIEIDGRERRGHVERNLVLAREHGDGVRADLVCRVAVGRDAVGADNDEIDPPLLHQRAAHVVGDDRRLDAVTQELPRRQPGALQERPRLVGEHDDALAFLDRAADHAQRGTVAGRRERAGVAMRENARVRRHHLRAEGAHRATTRDVLVVNRHRLAVESILDLPDRFPRPGRGAERSLHPVDRPEQVHGGRPRSPHQLARLVELGGEFLGASGRAPAHAQGDAHRGRDADGRRSADDHRPDRARDFGRRLAADVDFLCRKLALVDHHHRVGLSRDRGEHRSIVQGSVQRSAFRVQRSFCSRFWVPGSRFRVLGSWREAPNEPCTLNLEP